MRIRGWIISLFLAFSATALLGQEDGEVTFELKLSKERLGVNERLRADFVMNKDGDNFVPPDFEGFRVLMGPSQSISSSWINGVRSYSKTYTYVLAPEAKGRFTIGQGTIVISGEVHKTIPREVTVTEAVDNPNGAPSVDEIADENLHLVAEVSKTNPYMNEPVSVVYKLYFSSTVGVSNFRPLDNPKYNNFWSQEIPFSKYSIENGTYGGQPYRYVVLKRVVLYPQKSGELAIEPLALEVSLEVPTDKRNFFGERIYATANKTVSAGRRTLQVRPLPEAGKPAGFSGAVGDLDFEVTTSKTSLKATESLQATVSVSGSGNLKLFQLPKLTLPSSLEVYEPEFSEDIRTTISGMQGSVSEQYTIVPGFQGKYPIPPINFSWFNPRTETYESMSSDEITIEVTEGPTAVAASTPAAPGAVKSPVISGNQFYFIKLRPELSSKTWSPFFGSRAHIIWLLAPLLLIPLFVVLRRKQEERQRDVVGNKVKRANRLARRYLSRARKLLGQKDAFYVALERALHNYLKAKLKIETSEFSKDKIRELLTDRGVASDAVDDFTRLLENCEMARYSPFSRVQMQQDYDKASEVITELDKSL
ncbi:BatD family protein [Robiginitalea biformata]|uniref:Aerotolerance-related exported protein n=1 Tax=Robiginitalea biformata (strain ATCC BAA-864 / DSM 15991 / KCTC 12146 / HTCC2501) TaxID=313596 RepID=A4CIJ1_ROBBH|nr:BatD family protein [Robiginitalea biformata]EAR16749.1 aerotolerance-related exported protein [Robiginitalea biformata HTCC2501]